MDIDSDNDHIKAKRRKTLHDNDNGNFSLNNHFLHKRIPLNYEYIPITFSDGRRQYLTFEEPTPFNFGVDNKTWKPSLLDNLSQLVQTAEDLLKFKASSCKIINNNIYIDQSKANISPSQLWVKKYEPAGYLDLISAENINRQLLCWLRAWDYSVFGIEPKSKILSSLPETSESISAKNNQSAIKFKTWKSSENELSIGQVDVKTGRPIYKIVLLSGPPGLGKTTMAHLIARHAGYQVVEMNSSDDRSPAFMEDYLSKVVSNQASLNTAASTNETSCQLKPSCLVIDEIDGALIGAVEILAAAACRTGEQHKKGVRRGKSSIILRRPVICICNDLYAPSLRPLRAPGFPCYILRLPTIELNRLVARLDNIAFREEIFVDKNFLSCLAEASGRDIRSCLNILQFAKISCEDNAVLSVKDLPNFLNFDGVMKDTQHNLFSAWQAVFTIPPAQVLSRYLKNHKQRSAMNSSSEDLFKFGSIRFATSSDSSLQARVKYTIDICNSAGEQQNLFMGIFENYLSRRMKDASLQTARKASDWLIYSDLIWVHIQNTQNYTLSRYTSLLSAWFHLSFASTSETIWSKPSSSNDQNDRPGAIRWPTAYSENRTSSLQCTEIVNQLVDNQWHSGQQVSESFLKKDSALHSSLTSLRLLTRRCFLLDACSYINSIIGAMTNSLRPVNVQLYTVKEKEQLSHLTNLMITLGLNWSPQQVAEMDEQTYQLEPPLDLISQFTSLPKMDKNVSYATKQMLARELNLERMRRADATFGDSKATDAVQLPTTRQNPESFIRTCLNVLPTPVIIESTAKVKKDFFGRAIVSKVKFDDTKENIMASSKCPINDKIWFKFKEGHSNAVRRPFLMKQLI